MWRILKVVSGPKELQQSALDAVRQWVYKPFLLNGNPVEVTTTMKVTYTLKGNRRGAVLFTQVSKARPGHPEVPID